MWCCAFQMETKRDRLLSFVSWWIGMPQWMTLEDNEDSTALIGVLFKNCLRDVGLNFSTLWFFFVEDFRGPPGALLEVENKSPIIAVYFLKFVHVQSKGILEKLTKHSVPWILHGGCMWWTGVEGCCRSFFAGMGGNEMTTREVQLAKLTAILRVEWRWIDKSISSCKGTLIWFSFKS